MSPLLSESKLRSVVVFWCVLALLFELCGRAIRHLPFDSRAKNLTTKLRKAGIRLSTVFLHKTLLLYMPVSADDMPSVQEDLMGHETSILPRQRPTTPSTVAGQIQPTFTSPSLASANPNTAANEHRLVMLRLTGASSSLRSP